MVEILLKDGNANPNAVNHRNCTALMYCVVCVRGNLSTMKLLTKYGFDYAKLVNKRDNDLGGTVFQYLCKQGAIDWMKYLLQVCKNIPNCSINILATGVGDMCGLHWAVAELNVDMVRYLLENVYFPNNDKSNQTGIAFINMLIGGTASLAKMVLFSGKGRKDYDAKRHLRIFKLLVSYGMNLNNALETAIHLNQAEIVCFMLQENLYPIGTVENLFDTLGAIGVSAKEEIWKALYNYGINYNLIVESRHHVGIIVYAATINLSSFKMVLSIVLEHHGINNLKQYNQCIITNKQTLVRIAQLSDTTQDVKLFIDALISEDESKVSKIDETTGIQVTLTCVNNHEIKSSTNDNKMFSFLSLVY